MGRRKIAIQPLTDERNRSVTFLKRKAGLFKKAYELAVLCQVDITVIIFGHNNKLYEFSSVDDSQSVVDRFKITQPHEAKRPSDYDKSAPTKGHGHHDSVDLDDDDDSDDGTPVPTNRPHKPEHRKHSSLSAIPHNMANAPKPEQLKKEDYHRSTPPTGGAGGPVPVATAQMRAQHSPAPNQYQFYPPQQHPSQQGYHPPMVPQYEYVDSYPGGQRPAYRYPIQQGQPQPPPPPPPSQHQQHQQHQQGQQMMPQHPHQLHHHPSAPAPGAPPPPPPAHMAHQQNQGYPQGAAPPPPPSSQGGQFYMMDKIPPSSLARSQSVDLPPHAHRRMPMDYDASPNLSNQATSPQSIISKYSLMSGSPQSHASAPSHTMRPKLKVQIPHGDSSESQISSTEKSKHSPRTPQIKSNGPNSPANSIGKDSNNPNDQSQNGTKLEKGSNDDSTVTPKADSDGAPRSGGPRSAGGGPGGSSGSGQGSGSGSGGPWASLTLPPPSPSSYFNSNNPQGPGNPFGRPPLVTTASNGGEQTPLSAALPSKYVHDLLPSPSNFYGTEWSMHFGPASGYPQSATGGNPIVQQFHQQSPVTTQAASSLTAATAGSSSSHNRSARTHLGANDMLPSPLQFATSSDDRKREGEGSSSGSDSKRQKT